MRVGRREPAAIRMIGGSSHPVVHARRYVVIVVQQQPGRWSLADNLFQLPCLRGRKRVRTLVTPLRFQETDAFQRFSSPRCKVHEHGYVAERKWIWQAKRSRIPDELERSVKSIQRN